MESTKAKRANKPMPTADDYGAGTDLISGLNDDVLVRILQLVGDADARQVVRTGALSRRWRGLWTRAPALHFDAGPVILSPRGARRFIAFVDNALALRAGSDDSGIIERLVISMRVCRGRGEPPLPPLSVGSAVGWIRYAARRGAAFLSLSVRVHRKDMLGKDQEEDDGEAVVVYLGDLPSSTKLETMHLFLGGARVRLPSSTVFTTLTDLALECFEIAGDSSHLLGRLLSSSCCPRLQKLRLWAIRFDRAGTKELVIESSTLVEVSMYDMDLMESLELRTPNLLNLEAQSCRELRTVTVSAAGLKELTFSRNHWRVVIYGDVSCVWRLEINLSSHAYVSPYHNDSSINDDGICLLKRCRSSATCLLVDLDIPSRGDYYVDVIKDKIPQLPNVTSLAVKIHIMCERHSTGDGVAGLLTRFNNLRYLSLKLDEYPGGTKRADDIYGKDAGDLAFICSHDDHWTSNEISLAKLCTAEFRGLTGTGCELRFLRFMLASATDLEKVTVGFSMNYKLGGRIDAFLYGLLGNGTWTACKDKSYEWKPYS
ncbi:unnamed protein product [Urochloa humidicola]